MTWDQDPAALLGPNGPFSRVVNGFAPRAEQQIMARAVSAALCGRTVLISEAGTGTGKTFAYLVPALLSGAKVILSTGTRTLQDQLFHRDIPVVRKALGMPGRVALLKGRANYLCLHRLDHTVHSAAALSRTERASLQVVQTWAQRTRSGDIAEVGEIPEGAALWQQVTSTADNCLGQGCRHFADCHVVRARRGAQEADLVVVNHHLLFADLALKDEGFGELLPGADAFILDEAHQLPEVATAFFGTSVGSRQIEDLLRDTQREAAEQAGELAALRPLLDRVPKPLYDLRLAMGSEIRRGAWLELLAPGLVSRPLEQLQAALGALGERLAVTAERSKGLESCWRRSVGLLDRLALVTGPDIEQRVQWFETRARSFSLHVTPLDIAPTFQACVAARRCAWIFTSATLAVGARFDHFAARMGLRNAETLRLESPFDYASNALLYVPPAMPDPAAPEYTDAVVARALPILEASRGRAFLLFTSHRALRRAAELLQDRLPFPLLVQGEAPRAELLSRFRAHGDAVLLGTGSFWEGVDVRGPALSCVIIDRLPFASPGDPILQARIATLRASGGNPFVDWQLPSAVLSLKQGVGRLIRGNEDRGVMVVCDPRLLSRRYGSVFVASLPPMTLTRNLEDVQHFFVPGQP